MSERGAVCFRERNAKAGGARIGLDLSAQEVLIFPALGAWACMTGRNRIKWIGLGSLVR